MWLTDCRSSFFFTNICEKSSIFQKFLEKISTISSFLKNFGIFYIWISKKNFIAKNIIFVFFSQFFQSSENIVILLDLSIIIIF